jgi:hypothetical protein
VALAAPARPRFVCWFLGLFFWGTFSGASQQVESGVQKHHQGVCFTPMSKMVYKKMRGWGGGGLKKYTKKNKAPQMEQ